MEIPSQLEFSEIIPAEIQAVWQAWTTEEGARSFFAPQCRIDLRPGGAYEMYFDLEAPAGLRGGEGCVVLAADEPNLLSFTWNAPPELPRIREQHTHVSVYFTALEGKRTCVTLIHDGWGWGKDWERAREYFIRAWGQVVLPRLKKRFIIGPIDWEIQKSREQ
jgi:uncharacterized protein YndB with AHSA1/START domain